LRPYLQIAGQQQHDRAGRYQFARDGPHERACLAAAQRRGDRPCDGAEEAGLGCAEAPRRAGLPQVKEPPAAEASRYTDEAMSVTL
jgi:hypothetical protein